MKGVFTTLHTDVQKHMHRGRQLQIDNNLKVLQMRKS